LLQLKVKGVNPRTSDENQKVNKKTNGEKSTAPKEAGKIVKSEANAAVPKVDIKEISKDPSADRSQRKSYVF
jgi:hypothetical protein